MFYKHGTIWILFTRELAVCRKITCDYQYKARTNDDIRCCCVHTIWCFLLTKGIECLPFTIPFGLFGSSSHTNTSFNISHTEYQPKAKQILPMIFHGTVYTHGGETNTLTQNLYRLSVSVQSQSSNTFAISLATFVWLQAIGVWWRRRRLSTGRAANYPMDRNENIHAIVRCLFFRLGDSELQIKFEKL